MKENLTVNSCSEIRNLRSIQFCLIFSWSCCLVFQIPIPLCLSTALHLLCQQAHYVNTNSHGAWKLTLMEFSDTLEEEYSTVQKMIWLQTDPMTPTFLKVLWLSESQYILFCPPSFWSPTFQYFVQTHFCPVLIILIFLKFRGTLQLTAKVSSQTLLVRKFMWHY